MTSTFLRRWLATLAFALFVARTAGAQTVTTSTGTIPITLTQANYANLSQYDCENNGDTQVTFSFTYTWESGQVAEYFLSTDQTCVPPEGSAINEGGTAGQSATSARVETLNPLPEPSDGMTTNSDDTTNLTFAGIWTYYAQAMADASGITVLTYDAAPTTPSCPSGVDMQAVYLCVLIQTPATTTGGIQYVSGAFPFNLDSQPPDAPNAPSITSRDSELAVSWNDVTTPIQADYYTVHVALASGATIDGGILDAGTLTDGGVSLPPSLQSNTVSTQTNDTVTGLTNGVTYDVWVVATDSAGSNPPMTANTSPPSPIVQGTPIPSIGYFQAYKMDGGAENGGCASGGGVAAAVLLLALLLLWRRRRVAAALVAATLLGTTARAADNEKDDDGPVDITAPVVRQASPEWFRVDVMTGPFYPNPDNERGLSGKPYQQIFHPNGPLPNALLTKVEFHVNILNKLGHLSLGVALGIWQVQGHSLNLTETGTTGDQEALTLYPLSLILGWRMDFIYTHYGVPIVPVLKLGYGGVYFTDTKNGQLTYGVTNGVRWDSWGLAGGPEFAAGIEFPLDFLDPRRAANLDEDLGINSTGIFGEAAYNYYKGFNGGFNLSGPVYSGGLYIAF